MHTLLRMELLNSYGDLSEEEEDQPDALKRKADITLPTTVNHRPSKIRKVSQEGLQQSALLPELPDLFNSNTVEGESDGVRGNFPVLVSFPGIFILLIQNLNISSPLGGNTVSGTRS